MLKVSFSGDKIQYNFEGKEIKVGSLVMNNNKRIGIVLSHSRMRWKWRIYWANTQKLYYYFEGDVRKWKVLDEK